MQKQIYILFKLTALMIAAALITGCQEKEDNPSLYSDSNFHAGPAPVIDTIIGLNGDASKLASIARLKIVGKNFSTVLTENLVNFNNVRGTVVNASATELEVIAPNYANDTIYVSVHITGKNAALAPSNPKFYPLGQPLIEDKILSNQEVPIAMTMDNGNNLFVSLANENGGPGGVVKIDPAGNKTVVLPNDKQQQVWKDVKLANGGNLYFAGPLRAIKILRNGGTALENYAVFPAGDGVITLNSLDFDASLNLWVGGESASKKFYSVTNTTPQTITSFVFDGVIKALRVFNGYLYIGGRKTADGLYKVFRYPIVSGQQLGAEEVYYNLDTKYPGKVIGSITFSQDGALYVGINDGAGTNSAPGIVLVAAGGASSDDYYSGALIPAGSTNASAAYPALMWSNAKTLYGIRLRQYTGGTAAAPVTVVEQKLVAINALKNGAVYYGR